MDQHTRTLPDETVLTAMLDNVLEGTGFKVRSLVTDDKGHHRITVEHGMPGLMAACTITGATMQHALAGSPSAAALIRSSFTGAFKGVIEKKGH